jgi:hypothetical protein
MLMVARQLREILRQSLAEETDRDSASRCRHGHLYVRLPRAMGGRANVRRPAEDGKRCPDPTFLLNL